MYQAPQNLETLNLSYNHIKILNKEVVATLKNLITFDIANNKVE
ncbi:MAG: leucine-rich repeat domain-containing protein [Candidatus Roizmanbacteria bacterium]